MAMSLQRVALRGLQIGKLSLVLRIFLDIQGYVYYATYGGGGEEAAGKEKGGGERERGAAGRPGG